MKIDIKILNEINRYRSINNYINEQELPPPPGDVPPPPAGDTPPPPPGDTPPPPAADVPPPPGGAPPTPGGAPTTPPEPLDIENDPEVEKVDDKKEKKIKVTDLVKGQENVEKKQESYFENLFNHLNDLEEKLSAMDQIIDKLNNIETKIEKYRVKSPEEKLELRSLDSGPFNQKLSQFFQEKEDEFEESGKDQYVLTPDDVENYSQPEIKRSFSAFEDDEQNDVSGFKKIY
jgi:hypothetical protein